VSFFEKNYNEVEEEEEQ
jgi:hypothetical protein